MAFLLSSQNVLEYLLTIGLSTPVEQSLSKIELKPAKNFNLLVSLPDGRQLLVKQERLNREGKTAGEFFEEWRVHQFFQKFPDISHIRWCCSEAVHFDADNSIIVFNYLKNYRDLADFYIKENVFPTKIAIAVGMTLASIHHATMENPDYAEFFQTSAQISHLKNPNLTLGLDRITPEIFGLVPSEGLKFFTLYQRYDSLGQAIANLHRSYTRYCLTHHDLKLNNILLSLNWQEAVFNNSFSSERMIRLIDWERGAWGDPAHDLGMLIASYLQFWLYSMTTSKSMAIEESLRLATTPLELLQPSIAALMSTYLAHFPQILETCPDFLERVVQFCGLALITAIQAGLQHEKTFGNVGICMLQVAKSLLCNPKASMKTIFGVEALELLPQSFSRN
ncbi:aminoglycoside phosphotransferase family protein [Nostoc sp. LEGE 06077]|uniref:aminoglycoside phosphotransferase family protein n=1 Tax=Nostoc sp. LEGE 06077 TaxID=915325 RepID=UPI001881158A|nr:aminoglycoside phosphotransferase family protein [Nostoc sp. LEGE 06077]MBE9209809.1 aminoglycoside phosphotransferase family protein [Nostoc sp. LEGE 06077]